MNLVVRDFRIYSGLLAEHSLTFGDKLSLPRRLEVSDVSASSSVPGIACRLFAFLVARGAFNIPL